MVWRNYSSTSANKYIEKRQNEGFARFNRCICVEHKRILIILANGMKNKFGLLGLLFSCVTICILLMGCTEDDQKAGVELAWTYEPPQVGLPEGFTIGKHATAERIARWDIDVKPSGEGLPPGSGASEAGAQVYAIKCAMCHGIKGEGGAMGIPMRGPRLIGRVKDDDWSGEQMEANQPKVISSMAGDILKDHRTKMRSFESMTIGSYWPYSTTLYDYIYRAMPQTLPGSLKPDEVYSLVAYLLYRNEIIAEDSIMNATTLPQVKMPARVRFIMDNRLESNEVR